MLLMAGAERRHFEPGTAGGDYKLLSKAVVDIFERPTFSREQSYQPAKGLNVKPRDSAIQLYHSRSYSLTFNF